MLAKTKHPERYSAMQDIGSLTRILNVTPDNTPLYVKPGTSGLGRDQVTTEITGKFATKCGYTSQQGVDAFKLLVADYAERYAGNRHPEVIKAVKVITNLCTPDQRGQAILSHQVRHAVNVLHDATPTPTPTAPQEPLVTLEESSST